MKTLSTCDRIAVIHLSNRPLNSITLQLRVDLVNKLEVANDSADVDAIVIYGSEQMFSCGADIHEFFSGDTG